MITFAKKNTSVQGQGTAHRTPPVQGQGTADRTPPKTSVLLIDDEPDLTSALKSDLEATGRFSVHAENSAFMGMEAARTMIPDVIVLDVCMPFFDGGDVLASLELDMRLKYTKVIMLSSLVTHSETNEEGFIRSNGQLMMAKPVRLDKLLDCIDKRLAGQL